MGTLNLTVSILDEGDQLVAPATTVLSQPLYTEDVTAAGSTAGVTNPPSTPASAGVTTVVNGATSATPLLAANALRKGATFSNESAATLYILLGAGTVSSSNFTVTLTGEAAAPYSYYELPYGYTGAVHGIWGSAVGAVNITELS
jgi:hypothetical protein